MTIQMLAQWNGLEQSAVYTLSGGEEARLVTAGLARVYAPGIDGYSAADARAALRIVGERGNGQVLTAVVMDGWSVTSMQWTRITNGVSADISGATAASYTQVSADIATGVAVGCRPVGAIFTPRTGAMPSAQPLMIYASFPGGVVGVAYSGLVSAAGGVPPYTYAQTGGTLPAGLAPINASTGVVAGTPTTVATASGLVFRVTDALGMQASTSAQSIAVAAAGAAAPVITAPPQAAAVAEGATATFSVVATGTGLTYQWKLGAATIVGATSASYTTPSLTTGDTGGVYSVVVTNAGGSVTSAGAVLTVGAAVSYPAATGINVMFVGDSRIANSTDVATAAATNRTTASGLIAWTEAAGDYKFRAVANYGINTSTLDDMLTRATAAGISGGTPGDERRGYYNTAAPGNACQVFVLLAGVNNSNANQSIAIAGPKYDALIMALCDGGPGRTGLVLNEIPSNDSSGTGALHMQYRAYLDGWPGTSTTMTGPEKATYGAKVKVINSYDEIAVSPSSYSSKAGYYPAGDLLHPGAIGHRALGGFVGGHLAAMMVASGFTTSLASLITADAGQSINTKGLMAGSVAVAPVGETTGGTNLNGASGVGVTGVLPTGWSVVRGSSIRTLLNGTQGAGHQLDMAVSKVVDSDGYDAIRVALSGQLGTAGTVYTISVYHEDYYSAGAMAAANGYGVADGDAIYGACRLQLAADPQGLYGPSIEANLTNAAVTSGLMGAFTGGTLTGGPGLGGMAAFDDVVRTPRQVMPTGMAAAAGTTTVRSYLSIFLGGGVPISATVTISRFGVRREVAALLAGALMLGSDLLSLGTDLIGLI